MKFFKNPAVAVILTLLIIALSCVWGYTRVYLSTQTPETNIGSDRVSGESNLNYYLRWTSDSAELFSADTIDTIARTNLVLDGSYGSLMALKTVHHLNGMDIQTYAKNTADQIELGDRDLLLLLDAKGIAASSGSAFTSGSLDPSHVLLAIGLKHEVAHGSLRISQPVPPAPERHLLVRGNRPGPGDAVPAGRPEGLVRPDPACPGEPL